MIEKRIENFDIGQIAKSGQCFRMEEIKPGCYAFVAGDAYMEVYQDGENFRFDCSQKDFDDQWKQYFDLETDYGRMKEMVDPLDSYLSNAVSFGQGIRILKQDLWEMIITFIISQRNNIPRIKKCVQEICEKFGEQKNSSNGTLYYAFPSIQSLAEASVEELMACHLGYRSKYISKTAKSIADGSFVLEDLYDLDYESAKSKLMELCGVGIKVSECISLFALHHIEAFPIDTHIQQVLDEHYSEQGFPFEAYPGCAGVMQQYIFYYELFGK